MKAFWICVPALAVALSLVSFAIGSLPAVIAFGLGLVGTALYLGATWQGVSLVSRVSTGGSVRPAKGLFAGLAIAAKVPLIYLAFVFSKGLGPFGPTAFLLGLASVYCALIWRAVLAARD